MSELPPPRTWFGPPWVLGPPRGHRGCFVEFWYVDGERDGGLNIRSYGVQWVSGRLRRVVIRAWPGSRKLCVTPIVRISAHRCRTPNLQDWAHNHNPVPNVYYEGRQE